MKKMRRKLTTLFTLAAALAGLLGANSCSAQDAPLTIKTAINQALANNYSLKADSMNLRITASQARTAKADLLPQVNYSNKVEYNPAIPSQMLPGSIAGQPGKDYVPVRFGTTYALSSGIDVSQSLVKKSTRLQVGLAELNTGIARTRHRLTKEELVYQVAISFYTLQTSAEMIRTTDHDYRNLEKILAASKAQYEQGALKKIDYQSLEINVRNKLSYLQQLQSQYAEQLAGFNYLLGIPAGSLTVIDESRSRTTDSIVAGNLLTQREDLHLSRQLIESKELEIKSIKAESLPSLNSYFRFGYQAQLGNLDKTFNNDYWFKSSTVGISTSIPIFDGFRRKSRVSTATIQLQQLKLQHEDKTQLAQMEWIRENEKLNNNKMQHLINRQNLELAEKVFTSRMALYTEGITSLIELLDAEKDLTQARDLYTQSEINVLTGIAGVHKAKGTLLTEFIQSL